jgi:hypothetical protein
VTSSSINIPERYDEGLLEVSTEDFCEPDAVPKDAVASKIETKLCLWRPSTWIRASMVNSSPTRLLIKEAGEPNDSPDSSSKSERLRTPINLLHLPLNPRQAQIAAHITSLGLVHKSAKGKNDSARRSAEANPTFEVDSDFDDEDFGYFEELTLANRIPSLLSSPIQRVAMDR